MAVPSKGKKRMQEPAHRLNRITRNLTNKGRLWMINVIKTPASTVRVPIRILVVRVLFFPQIAS